MDNVESFYATHSRWLESHYFGPVDDYRRRFANLVSEVAPPEGTVRVLELGCGGGQAAAAVSDLGSRFSVTAVELDPAMADHARGLAAEEPERDLHIVQGDFYAISLSGTFDIVCYWDGFGIGTDADHRRLLLRIEKWLSADGVVLIDVTSTAAAIRRHDSTQTVIPGKVTRSITFDTDACRLIDVWRTPTNAITQSLRCYTPEDFRLLVDGTGLVLDRVCASAPVSDALRACEGDELREVSTWLAFVRKR